MPSHTSRDASRGEMFKRTRRMKERKNGGLGLCVPMFIARGKVISQHRSHITRHNNAASLQRDRRVLHNHALSTLSGLGISG